jgi:Protein of unknown function (DUF3750)
MLAKCRRTICCMQTIKVFNRLFLILFLAPLVLHAIWWTATDPAEAWNQADWSSANLLPPPAAKREAMVHVYAARVGRWRGIFAHHTWIVVKDKGADRYTRFDVVAWGRPVKVDGWAPDAHWYGHTPTLVGAIEGQAAESVVPKVRAAVAAYPHGAPGAYTIWPGPNSNSFVAYILQQIPNSGIALPPTAIGKDWRADGKLAGPTASGTGYQVSFKGLLGLSGGLAEGIEVNLLGLVVGLDIVRPAIKLPGFGRIGWPAA